MRRWIITVTAVLLGVLCLFAGGEKGVAYAADEAAENAFSGDVGMLRQDGGNYVMQVTVENRGEDFTGTVQVIFENSSMRGNCAYNTEITLPAQGRKQYTLTVTERAVDTVRGLCALNFLDEEGEVVQSLTLRNVFGNAVQGIPVGVLSDDEYELTYLDAGGEDFNIQGMSYPLKLVELDDGNLQGYLDGLYFLIIDRFNVSSLSEENIQAIQDWVKNGGWLLIGTGAYGEQTLSGFDEDFLDIEVISVSDPPAENLLTVNADRYGYYYYYVIGAEIDFAQMAVAELDYYSQQDCYESSENPFVCSIIGDGAAAVFFCSLGEKELQKLEDYMILYIYSEIAYQSDSYHSMGGNSDLEYDGQRALAFIDSRNTNVDFGFLKVLIGIYVVLVGPVLYLILRKCRKKEWYWVGVPALGLIFIGAVFFLGNGARVNETKVYSVTTQRADSNQEDTYFLAYRSGIKPWKVRLEDRYEVAGPGWSGYWYNNRNGSGVNDYYYMVGNDSEGLSVGIKPVENFESAYLYAGGKTQAKGSLSATGLSWENDGSYYGTFRGAVTNSTSFDLDYMAVWADSYIMVFADVKAGETLELQQALKEGRCVYQSPADMYGDLLYSMVSIYSNSVDSGYEQDDMAALFIGLGLADEARPAGQDNAVIAGVIRDYEKAVADKCSETSYGCLYSYAEWR